MNYIDLTLTKVDSQEDIKYTFSQIMTDYELIVILGVPGSGKTKILENYQETNSNDVQYIKVKNFLLAPDKLKKETKVLLLDGLDEYRSTEVDKAFVITKLGDEVKSLRDKNIKVVITCREMDWSGEYDKNALESQITKEEVSLFRIMPLDDNQKLAFSKMFNIENSDAFLDKFSHYGFLENPQLFKMMANVYNENPQNMINSKKDLYLTFIKAAREQNSAYKRNEKNQLQQDEILKLTGYVAFYYMFSNVDKIDDQFIDAICDQEHDYTKDKIKIVLNTPLFIDGNFCHRTIAEFAMAYFLKNYLLNNGAFISLGRVKNLFVKNEIVPTELRGAYAWLCSLTQKKDLIAVDPYYQAIHGDNSLFDVELKKEIVLQVKKYAEMNPYFYRFNHYMDLEGFYTPDLDGFFMQEIENALSLKNHYIYFVINAVIAGSNLSEKMRKFLKERIQDDSVRNYYKREMIEAFYKDVDFMKEVLSSIKDQKIPDEDDSLKEYLLRGLYPKHIHHDDVVEYLMLYRSNVVGRYYLFETEYKNKFALVDKIHESSFNKSRKPQLLFPKNVKYFIQDYFLETILKFEGDLTSKQIYEIIKHFKQYYKPHKILKPESYRYSISNKLEKKTADLTKLANELFSFYVDDCLRGEIKELYLFDYFFDYKSPTEQKNILLSKMNMNLDPAINRVLFRRVLSYCEEGDFEELNNIAERYGFKQMLYDWQHPKKLEWEIEHEEREKKEEEDVKRKKDKNEADIASMSDEQIQENFGILHFIAEHLYFESKTRHHGYLEDSTVDRLERILKKAIDSKLLTPELLTIESLAKNSPHANRHIDRVYYVSSCLHENDLDLGKSEENFIKYLYIINLSDINVGNVRSGKLVEKLESCNPELAKATLKEFIQLLFKKYFSEQERILLSYIDSKDDIETLKNIIDCHGNNDGEILNSIFRNFLETFNFDIALKNLKELAGLNVNDKNNTMLQALKVIIEGDKNNFSMSMAISIYSLFEHKLEKFKSFNSDIKIKIIDYMMHVFNTEELLKFQSGFQSAAARCANFLNREALYLFASPDILNALLKSHCDENDIWNKRILYRICEVNQVITDKENTLLPIQKLKDFIFSGTSISVEDFFEEIYSKIEDLRRKIEDNRDNDKNAFYNENGNSKKENACRDIIFQRLKDKYDEELCLTREKYEADKRADINIKYKKSHKLEVQVECKKDANDSTAKGISTQLIADYLSNAVQYGIYLIFYFGDKKDKGKLLKDVRNDVTKGFENKIRIICMDLTR